MGMDLDSTNIDPVTLLALSKLLTSKEHASRVREPVQPGDYEVDATIHVQGKVRVGRDHDSKVYAAVPWMRIVATALSKLNGVTLESVVREALDASPDPKEEKRVKDQAQAAVDRIMGHSQRPVKGAVKLDVDAWRVEV